MEKEYQKYKMELKISRNNTKERKKKMLKNVIDNNSKK